MAELNKLKIIAFTHRNFPLSEIGKLVLDKQEQEVILPAARQGSGLDELMMITTCNRVELVFVTDKAYTPELVRGLLQQLYPGLKEQETAYFGEQALRLSGQEALEHLMQVSCSLDSMVVGEKEILAQVRLDYEKARQLGLTYDFLRLVMNRVVKTAKEVYTETRIAERPVSVVSIANRLLQRYGVPSNARILIIGAGQTNRLFTKYLRKHGAGDFIVFNRTLEKGAALAEELGGKAYRLNELARYREGFDVILTCTGASEPVLTGEVYRKLLNGDTSRKIILDLAVPHDVTADVLEHANLRYIGVEELQEVARKNMAGRTGELEAAEAIIYRNIMEFKPILRQRKIELAMSEVPLKIKEIRSKAINTIFAEDIRQLDSPSREVLEKVLNYMEKRYVSEPMVMAKKILLNAD